MRSFISECMQHSQKAWNFIKEQIDQNGKLKNYPQDMTCYYKLPYFLAINGQNILANKVLDHIQHTFFKNNHFAFDQTKSENPCINLFWGYAVGWVALAAHKLDRFEISYPAYTY